MTIYDPDRKLLGNGELLDGVYEQSDSAPLGATCVFSFSVEVSDTLAADDGEYPYTVVLGDGSEWHSDTAGLQDGMNIGVSASND